MANANLIPVEQRWPRLKEFLLVQCDILAKVKTSAAGLIPENVIPFLYLAYPWIVAPVGPDQEALFAARREQFEKVGFNGCAVRDTLGEILVQDKHLRECCVGLAQLAHCLDLNFLSPATSLVGANAPKERLEELFERFISTIYGQGRFKVISLSHIFNFQSEDASLRFGDIRVERLDSPTISRILGEESFGSFIHTQGTGDHFVVSELEGACDDYIGWLFDQKNKAELFTHVLQYFKDGIVHVNYAVPYFLPQWVNPVRKWGIFFIGNPRRLPYAGGKRPYSLQADELDAITRWWATYQDQQIFKRISDLEHTLRQAGLRAGEYYEQSHTQEKPEERLISLAIALEALFSPDDKGEFTFRISQSLAQLVGQSETDRVTIFRDTKQFYAWRSALIHGQYDVKDYLQGRFVTHEECDRWASPIRRAILRFLTLYLRGRNRRDELLNELSLAAIDLTGLCCTSQREREFTRRTAGHAKQEV